MIEVRRCGKNDAGTIMFAVFMLLLVVMACLSEEVLFAALLAAPFLAIIIYRATLSIEMNKNGCEMKSLFSKKFLMWSDFQTIRFQDFSRSNCSRDCYLFSDQGIIFSTRRIRKNLSWTWMDPASYFSFTDPVCRYGFYIQFDPTEKCERKEKIHSKDPIPYHVDYEEFMARAEEWGLKIEGLNAPMPPELTKTKKKR